MKSRPTTGDLLSVYIKQNTLTVDVIKSLITSHDVQMLVHVVCYLLDEELPTKYQAVQEVLGINHGRARVTSKYYLPFYAMMRLNEELIHFTAVLRSRDKWSSGDEFRAAYMTHNLIDVHEQHLATYPGQSYQFYVQKLLLSTVEFAFGEWSPTEATGDGTITDNTSIMPNDSLILWILPHQDEFPAFEQAHDVSQSVMTEKVQMLYETLLINTLETHSASLFTTLVTRQLRDASSIANHNVTTAIDLPNVPFQLADCVVDCIYSSGFYYGSQHRYSQSDNVALKHDAGQLFQSIVDVFGWQLFSYPAFMYIHFTSKSTGDKAAQTALTSTGYPLTIEAYHSAQQQHFTQINASPAWQSALSAINTRIKCQHHSPKFTPPKPKPADNKKPTKAAKRPVKGKSSAQNGDGAQFNFALEFSLLSHAAKHNAPQVFDAILQHYLFLPVMKSTTTSAICDDDLDVESSKPTPVKEQPAPYSIRDIPLVKSGCLMAMAFSDNNVTVSTIKHLISHKVRLKSNSNGGASSSDDDAQVHMPYTLRCHRYQGFTDETPVYDSLNVFNALFQTSSHQSTVQHKFTYLIDFLERNRKIYAPDWPLEELFQLIPRTFVFHAIIPPPFVIEFFLMGCQYAHGNSSLHAKAIIDAKGEPQKGLRLENLTPPTSYLDEDYIGMVLCQLLRQSIVSSLDFSIILRLRDEDTHRHNIYTKSMSTLLKLLQFLVPTSDMMRGMQQSYQFDMFFHTIVMTQSMEIVTYFYELSKHPLTGKTTLPLDSLTFLLYCSSPSPFQLTPADLIGTGLQDACGSTIPEDAVVKSYPLVLDQKRSDKVAAGNKPPLQGAIDLPDDDDDDDDDDVIPSLIEVLPPQQSLESAHTSLQLALTNLTTNPLQPSSTLLQSLLSVATTFPEQRDAAIGPFTKIIVQFYIWMFEKTSDVLNYIDPDILLSKSKTFQPNADLPDADDVSQQLATSRLFAHDNLPFARGVTPIEKYTVLCHSLALAMEGAPPALLVLFKQLYPYFKPDQDDLERVVSIAAKTQHHHYIDSSTTPYYSSLGGSYDEPLPPWISSPGDIPSPERLMTLAAGQIAISPLDTSRVTHSIAGSVRLSQAAQTWGPI